MLERPEIPEKLICASAQSEYRLEVLNVTFLPLGYDVNTAVYRIQTQDGVDYFLKLRMGKFDPNTVEVPNLLNSLGIHTVMAPIKTHSGQLSGRLDDFSLILYPFISGKNGYEVPLTNSHWLELGWTLAKVHTAKIPPSISSTIPCEVFDPQWRESVKFFQTKVEELVFSDSVAEKLSTFMKSKRDVINQIVDRAEELAHTLRKGSSPKVLCHSDAHPGNYLITDNGELYLVDWDNPIFAPKERDLMFFGSGMAGDQPGGWEERAFYQGYGTLEVNQFALAYYRYERIIQDIAEFCKQLLLTVEGGEDREQAYIYFTGSFLPGNVVDVAFGTDRLINRPT